MKMDGQAQAGREGCGGRGETALRGAQRRAARPHRGTTPWPASLSVALSVLMGVVYATAGWVFPEDLAFLLSPRRATREEREKRKRRACLPAGWLEGPGRTEVVCVLCAPRSRRRGQDEGGPGPEVAGSEGWREGAILPWWRVGRCPVSLPAVGPSMSSPLAALNLAVCSAESRTGWCHPVCPKPSPLPGRSLTQV